MATSRLRKLSAPTVFVTKVAKEPDALYYVMLVLRHASVTAFAVTMSARASLLIG